MCFILFGCIWDFWLPYETRRKTGREQKFVPRSRIGIFHNKHTRSTPLDPKLMFCRVLYYLVAFGTVWLPYETRYKTGRTSAKVRATKSRRNFSQRTHPIHPIGPETDVLVHFALFSVHSGPFGCLTKLGAKRPNYHKSSCHEVASEFFATNTLDPPHWTTN